jgi:TMEM175 potassium channel family protein
MVLLSHCVSGDQATPAPDAKPPQAEHVPAGERHGPEGHRGPRLYPMARSGFIEYDRVLFFTDAVFAIAITLLAIDLKVLTDVNGNLRIDTRGLVSFGISFAVIGLFWLGHHGIFRYIVAFDRPLISINLFFLGTIALLPYPTKLLEIGKSGSAQVVFYAACVAAAGLGECMIWLYATRPRGGLASPAATAIRLRYALRIARVPVVFLASIPVAVVAPHDAPYMWLLIFIFGLLINRFMPQPEGLERIGEQIRG